MLANNQPRARDSASSEKETGIPVKGLGQGHTAHNGLEPVLRVINLFLNRWVFGSVLQERGHSPHLGETFLLSCGKAEEKGCSEASGVVPGCPCQEAQSTLVLAAMVKDGGT